MHYHITHTTTYEYSRPVTLYQSLAHLTPREAPRQCCRHSLLTIDPAPAVLTSRADYFGNPATFFTVQQPHWRLTVRATHRVELTWETAPDAARTPPWEQVRDRLPRDRSRAGLEAYQFVFASRYLEPGEDWAEYARPSFAPGRPLLDAAMDLTARIHADFVYDPQATTVATPLRQVLAQRRGVCQDFAHLEIACLRSLGLAARYVSGYLCTVPPPGEQRLIGADATHAWVSVYDGGSWVDLDPTNNQIPSDRHILLAWGRDYDDVSPIKGVVTGGGQHAVWVAVEVSSPEGTQEL